MTPGYNLPAMESSLKASIEERKMYYDRHLFERNIVRHDRVF